MDFFVVLNHLPGLSWLLVLSTGCVEKRKAKTRDRRERRQIEKKGVLLSAKAGWEGEEAGRRVHPEGRGESQGHRGEGRCRGGAKGGRGKRRKANAHIEKSTNLVTFSKESMQDKA